MWQAAQKDEFSEIFVLGDEYALLLLGERQQRFVCGVRKEVMGG